jgi:hypothetical protein
VAEGELTPLEGAKIMALIETFRKTPETCELEARVVALEARAALFFASALPSWKHSAKRCKLGHASL